MKDDSNDLDNECPLLSVFLASYNQAKYVVDFINGWKSQSFQNFEIIAVDSFSEDGTAELLGGYSKVKLFQKKCSAAEAWLMALNNCRGKYVVIATTSDYIFSHTWAERAINVLESDPELSLVWGSGIHISENGWFEGIYAYRFLRAHPPVKKEYLAYWMHDDYIPELGSVVSAKVYRECVADFLDGKVDITFFTVHFRYEFTARGFLQKYIPDLAFAGRTHPNQYRDIWSEKEFELNQSLKVKQKQILRAIIVGRHRYKYLDRDGNVLSEMTLGDRIFLMPKVLRFRLKTSMLNLATRILKIVRGL
jgi:glycosyltransferase involved in cell wall biosynthesis